VENGGVVYFVPKLVTMTTSLNGLGKRSDRTFVIKYLQFGEKIGLIDMEIIGLQEIILKYKNNKEIK